MGLISEAPVAWRLLNGVICVYKPSGVSSYDLRKTLIGNIASDLCDLKCRPPTDYVSIQETSGAGYEVSTVPSYADHPLVVGPRYQPKDVRCAWATYLGKHTSGVFVLGLNRGISVARKLHRNRPIRTYHVSGRLGEATDTYFTDGKVVEKSTFRHVKHSILDRILASIQAAHQKHMFEQCGIDIQSQAAYELAVQGLIRPHDSKIPIIYGIKCVSFDPPNFTLEIHSMNEYEDYLKTLIHEIGLQLHSVATCTAVRCIKYSHFSLEYALLRKHWHLQHILNNLILCQEIIDKYKYLTNQTSAKLINTEEESRTLLEAS
ncbi:pseudouridylate synthase TRUB2, mitochondrial [Anabrus simplex]|uniref:pseudouridylate synthase TRUB2, mitochondrial n=1 Tax=Anabrus simplex TaxID=316456 RepID=UPI0034DD5DCA